MIKKGIFRKTENNYIGIYCHYDGHPEACGKILAEHYKDLEKVKDLINLGNISSLGKEIGEKHSFDDAGEWCTAYHRDRGEPFKRFVFNNLDAVLNCARENGIQYIYLYSCGRWFYTEDKHEWFVYCEEESHWFPIGKNLEPK